MSDIQKHQIDVSKNWRFTESVWLARLPSIVVCLLGITMFGLAFANLDLNVIVLDLFDFMVLGILLVIVAIKTATNPVACEAKEWVRFSSDADPQQLTGFEGKCYYWWFWGMPEKVSRVIPIQFGSEIKSGVSYSVQCSVTFSDELMQNLTTNSFKLGRAFLDLAGEMYGSYDFKEFVTEKLFGDGSDKSDSTLSDIVNDYFSLDKLQEKSGLELNPELPPVVEFYFACEFDSKSSE
ncbi:MAG: hypothetical protein OXR68_03500 [Alphaproteobacteria bacterium]|nr:hypothetical protein [Alphaproteobacteria bacterium]MDD9919672.1 hypothetical protein [Alphaproteobacteria bacterium]